VLELGAGLGVVSSAIVRAVRPMHYAAVEADPRLIAHIARTHELNNVAVSEIIHAAFVTNPRLLKQGHVEFVQSKAFWGSSLTLDNDLAESRVEVPVRDMSAYVREAGITALICDIEGGELELFAKLDFAGIKKIILELHPAVYGKRGVTKLLRWLAQAGFEEDLEHSGVLPRCSAKLCKFTWVNRGSAKMVLALFLLAVVFAFLPFGIAFENRAKVGSGTTYLMYGMSLFALCVLYVPIQVTWCVLQKGGCYGDGWAELMTFLATLILAIGVTIAVNIVAAKGRREKSGQEEPSNP